METVKHRISAMDGRWYEFLAEAPRRAWWRPPWVKKRTSGLERSMSALPLTADIDGQTGHVRFVSRPEVAILVQSGARAARDHRSRRSANRPRQMIELDVLHSRAEQVGGYGKG